MVYDINQPLPFRENNCKKCITLETAFIIIFYIGLFLELILFRVQWRNLAIKSTTKNLKRWRWQGFVVDCPPYFLSSFWTNSMQQISAGSFPLPARPPKEKSTHTRKKSVCPKGTSSISSLIFGNLEFIFRLGQKQHQQEWDAFSWATKHFFKKSPWCFPRLPF